METKIRIYCLLLFVIACVGQEVEPPKIYPLTSTSVDAEEYITLMCNLTSPTFYTISWNWYCDGRYMNLAVVNSVKNQSTLRFRAEKKYDQAYCNCRARYSNKYDKSSNLQPITVYHVPSGGPSLRWISPSIVREGESIILQCSLSSSANPPVTWSWFCGEEAIRTGIISKGKVSELELKTEEKHDSKFCYCQATTNRSSLNYDRTSSRKKLQIYYIPKTSPKLSVVTSTSVDNGKFITLMCTLPTPGNPVIDWYWYCNGNSMSSSFVTSAKNQTILKFKAIKSHDQAECHCRAKYSKIYDSSSKSEKLTVFYAPSGSPFIRWISPSSVAEGQSIILQCSLSSLGNPSVSWSWICDESNIDKGITNRNTVSELKMKAEAKYDNKFCYCQATTNQSTLHYDRTSSRQKISVKYVPSTYPRITSLTTSPVTEGSPVTLRCTLSQLGNPPIKWSWTCDSSDIADGVSNTGKTSELAFVADGRFKQILCYCRAKSGSRTLEYDQTSSKKIITVKEFDNGEAISCGSVSTTKYHVAIGVVVVLLGSCLVVIVVLVLKIFGRGPCFDFY